MAPAPEAAPLLRPRSKGSPSGRVNALLALCGLAALAVRTAKPKPSILASTDGPPVLATTLANASSANASAATDRRRFATQIIESLKDSVSFSTSCAVEYAYCGKSSCTRSNKDAAAGGVEIAACACHTIRASDEYAASITWSDSLITNMLAQSDDFVELAALYLSDGIARTDFEAGVCEEVQLGRFFPALSPDLISLPPTDTSAWDTTHAMDTVQTDECGGDEISIALCSGAPCFRKSFRDTWGAGVENVTCLCPVYPFGAQATLSLGAPDVGHFGGCSDYDLDDGGCSLQYSANYFKGDALREWAVDAVDSMATASRRTDTEVCRAWIAKEEFPTAQPVSMPTLPGGDLQGLSDDAPPLEPAYDAAVPHQRPQPQS